MTFKIEFSVDNAAFDGNTAGEIERIMKKITGKLLDGDGSGIVKDSNGNTIGSFGFNGKRA